MNISMPSQVEDCSDADLVRLCLQDNPDAFAVLVERHKNLLCGLAYGFCGDFGHSEDLAQEAFVIAWRKLAHLESPEKFKAWLCGILRHLWHNSARAQAADPLSDAASFEAEPPVSCTTDTPIQSTISNEEAALLWRCVGNLPEQYRQPLVLYYRCGDSTAEVAESLDLSEEAVRQRLSRARTMLGTQMVRVVESGLRRSGPKVGFTAAVLAALPLGKASAATAASVGVSTAKGAAGAANLAAGVSGLLGLGSGIVALTGHILNTRSLRERKFVRRALLGFVALSILWIGLLGAVFIFGGLSDRGEWSKAIGLGTAFVLLGAPLDAWAIWMALRQRRIRAEEQSRPDFPIARTRRGYQLSMAGATAALAFGTMGWLSVIAASHGDFAISIGLLAMAALGALTAALVAIRRPQTCAESLIYLLWFLAALNILVVGFRWERWPATAMPGFQETGPVLLLIAMVCFAVRAGWFAKQWFLKSRHLRRDVWLAIGLLCLIVGAGVACRHLLRGLDAIEIRAMQALLADFDPDDSSMSFRVLCGWENSSDTELHELHFVASDPEPISAQVGPDGKALPFSAHYDGNVMHYSAPLKNPVPPGGTAFTCSTGRKRNALSKLSSGELELQERHWPATGVATLRVERYRFSEDTELVSCDLPVTVRRLPDRRLEVKLQQVISAWGHIEFRMRLRK